MFDSKLLFSGMDPEYALDTYAAFDVALLLTTSIPDRAKPSIQRFFREHWYDSPVFAREPLTSFQAHVERLDTAAPREVLDHLSPLSSLLQSVYKPA